MYGISRARSVSATTSLPKAAAFAPERAGRSIAPVALPPSTDCFPPGVLLRHYRGALLCIEARHSTSWRARFALAALRVTSHHGRRGPRAVAALKPQRHGVAPVIGLDGCLGERTGDEQDAAMRHDHGLAVDRVVGQDAHHAVRGAVHEGRERLAAVRIPVPVERALDRR